MVKLCIAEIYPKVLAERENEFRVGFYLPEGDSERMIGYGVFEEYTVNAHCDVHIQGIPRNTLLEMLDVEKPELYRYLRGEASRLFRKACSRRSASE